MTEVLSRFDGGELIGLVAVAGGLLVALAGIVAGIWHQSRLIALKQDMVSRGMSVDEIQAVLDSGSKHCHRSSRGRSACRV
jgi:hypothetical protein